MMFYQSPKKNSKIAVKIDGTPLERVDLFYVLGLMLDKHLNWNSHIDNKLSRTIGIINKLKHVLPQHVLLTLYNELVLPRINYCLLAWGDHHHTNYYKTTKTSN